MLLTYIVFLLGSELRRYAQLIMQPEVVKPFQLVDVLEKWIEAPYETSRKRSRGRQQIADQSKEQSSAHKHALLGFQMLSLVLVLLLLYCVQQLPNSWLL